MDEAVLDLPVRHRLDVDTYYRMAELGLLKPDERVELIDGEIFDMAPIGQDHEASVIGLTHGLVLACGDRALVSTQNSVRMAPWSAPQPDFAVLRYREDFYRTGERAGPGDVLLVIEVADSSLRFDRTVKLPLYASAGIPEYWIVNLKDRVLTAYREPSGDTYGVVSDHAATETIALAADPQIAIRLDRLF